MHDLPLISTIAAGFTVAWLLGLLTQWMRLSPIVGYLLAGIIIGPYSPGFVADKELAHELAEIGVILLMFGVGLHFHLKDLLSVRRVAIPGAVGQSLLAMLAAMFLFHAFGMSWSTGAVLGMAMAVASTVVLMRGLMEANSLHSPEGHVAVGWLIVEDIFTVILLVLIPVLGDGGPQAAEGHASGLQDPLWWTLGVALVKLVVLVLVLLWAGSRIIPRVLVRVARLRSRELFTLTVLVFSIAVAAASYFFFGASMALGAFLAGMVVGQSPVANQAAADALPMRDAFAVLFFVSVGMLFDPAFLIQEPLMVVAALVVILLVKPLAALIIVAVLGYSVRTALTVALGLAQIGEFSFILSDLAGRHGLLPEAGHHVLVAAAILSITVNPLFFRKIPAIETWLRSLPRLWSLLNARGEKRLATLAPETPGISTVAHSGSGKGPFALLIGYGPVGRTVHRVLDEGDISSVVIDLNMDTITALREAGKNAIFGDASNERILEEAGAGSATHLVITLPDAAQRAAIITAARNVNPDIRVVVRARYLREREELEQSGVTAAVYEEAEAAVALARLVLAGTGVHRDAARVKLEEIRFQLAIETFPDLRRIKVGAVMVPWSQVRTLSAALDRDAVRAKIGEGPHQMLPVVAGAGQVNGYLLVEAFLADTRSGEWTGLIRPLLTARSDDRVGDVFHSMCEADERICLIREGTTHLGIVTRGHLLDRVEFDFARAQTVRPAAVTLAGAVVRGGVVPHLESATREEAIRELASVIPSGVLPPGIDAEILCQRVFAREAEISTDLGNGIALPHARCDGLAEPVVVIGRAPEGIAFSDEEHGAVRLFFLLVTPAERPETHLALLSQVARLVSKTDKREALLAATTPVEFQEVIGG
jgi:CPA2 family monovalent cation:H+ antiporter-2